MASAFERIIKPDPAIFRLFCLRYRLDPAECLFVDDNTDNCEGARVAGMQGYHYTGDAAALEAVTRVQDADGRPNQLGRSPVNSCDNASLRPPTWDNK